MALGLIQNIPGGLPAIPPDTFLLERPRIHGLLAQSLESGILLISAGEGCGKTYAVNSFLRKRSEMAIWIQNSARDNQPAHFWENYSRAMGHCKPAAEKSLRETGFPRTARQIAEWLKINRNEFSFPGRYIIVGDDFHCIQNKTVIDFLERALSYPIPSQTMIFLCRRDPDINLLPLLSKGRLTRIGAEELLFTKDEIADYFRLRNGDLSPEEIEAVYRDTEGWPAALEMASRAIQRDASGLDSVQPGADLGRPGYRRRIFGSGPFRDLEDDRFAALPAELQKYIIKLSLFDQWPLGLLEKTAALLPEQYRPLASLRSEFEKLGALVRYDYYLRGCRIHQVFLEYLREKQSQIPQAEIREISSIAARWCLDNDLRIEAALNFERAVDYTGIAGIADTFPRIIPQNAAGRLLEIIERLINSDNHNETDADFLYLRYVVRGRLFMCLSRFEEAVTLFRNNTRRFGALPHVPATLRVLCESWNYLGIIALLRRRHDSGENYDYITFFDKANHYYSQNPYPLSGPVMVCNVGSFVSQISHPAGPGEFERRINRFADSIPMAASSINGYLSGMDDLARTELAYYQGDLNAAEQYARGVVIKAREKYQYEIENRGLFFLMRICLHRGTIDDLTEILKQKEILIQKKDYFNHNIVNDIFDGWLYTHLGEHKRAAPWLRSQMEESDLYSIFRNYESIVKAKYLFAEKKYTETIEFLNLDKNRNGLGSFLLGMIEMNCLEAVSRYQLGDEAAAFELLEKTYRAAVPNLLNMPFIELGNDMRLLVSAILNAGDAAPCQVKKNQASGSAPDNSFNTPSGHAWLEEIRSLASAYGKNLFAVSEQFRSGETSRMAVYLTRQERQVLNSLSRGQTREAIAQQSGQPLSAIKSIISRLYGKLGAVNRADAIRIASGMGLLHK
ncbi:MAG: LuxR C-terminal-related transcriptional regulator [Treponema sp.]|jgi:LuxR family maltose regulon positive regulatory protein|nr:LuxR C-terminal-related transcriptional regulator [Treponema sp.]